MGIDIGKRIIERDDLASRSSCSCFVHIGLGPGEIIRAGSHEIGDSEGNGVVDQVEIVQPRLALRAICAGRREILMFMA